MTNNKSALFILLVFIVGIAAFAVSHTKQNRLSADIDLSYNNFLKTLENDCPYYEPNGARYRECLANLLAKRDKEVSDYLGRFILDLQADTDTEFLTARQTFVVDLAQLSSTWLTYRDQLCTVQADAYWGGSDQGGELNRCRLYETERFHRLLQNLRSEWAHQ